MKRSFFGPSGAVWLQVAMVGVAAACVAVAAPSCGGDVVVDGNPSSSGSGQGGASNSSGTPSGPSPVAQSSAVNGTSVTVNTGVGASGPVGSVGPGPGPQTAVSTGMVPCVTCSEFISGFEGPLCPLSQQLFDGLLSCVCSFCSFQCGGSCGNGGENGPQCDQCVEFTIQDACSSQFSQCANDA